MTYLLKIIPNYDGTGGDLTIFLDLAKICWDAEIDENKHPVIVIAILGKFKETDTTFEQVKPNFWLIVPNNDWHY